VEEDYIPVAECAPDLVLHLLSGHNDRHAIAAARRIDRHGLESFDIFGLAYKVVKPPIHELPEVHSISLCVVSII
jgi:hypothetical protein